MEDTRKLMFSLGGAQMADNSHRGISPLAFALLTFGEVNQLREDQEVYDGATSLTPTMFKNAQWKCFTIPVEFDKFERLIVRYKKAGQNLFTIHCPHFIEVNYIQQELMMIYRRNVGNLPKNTITGLLWDIVADSAQLFYNFTSVEDFNTTLQLNIPISTLSMRGSLLSVNLHVATIGTPKHWLTIRVEGLGLKRMPWVKLDNKKLSTIDSSAEAVVAAVVLAVVVIAMEVTMMVVVSVRGG